MARSLNVEQMEKYYEERNRRWDRIEKLTDEIIQMLEDAGYRSKSDDWKTEWEEMIKHVEEWEKRKAQRIEEQRREKQKNEEQGIEEQQSEEQKNEEQGIEEQRSEEQESGMDENN